MTYAYTCPTCDADIEAEPFTDDVVTCPGCGARWVTEHDCNYDGEDEWCSDWLEPAPPEALQPPERG